MPLFLKRITNRNCTDREAIQKRLSEYSGLIYKGFGMRETEQEPEIKLVDWVGSSRDDLKEFPADVQDEMGYALYIAQIGDKHPKAKPLKGFSGVMEIRSNYASNTYRAVYTTKIGDRIYVLHAFQKKSTRGIQTPQKEIDLIKRRLQRAQELAQGG